MKNQSSAANKCISAPRSVGDLHPVRGISVIDEHGINCLSGGEVLIERVGCKAFGICSLPVEWAVPCIVIDGDFAKTLQAERDQATINTALQQVGINLGANLMVRSSGIGETLQQRGRLSSRVCSVNEVVGAIKELYAGLPKPARGVVHWILQAYHDASATGHLSNERRLSREKRDWIAEIEPNARRRGYSNVVAVRPWRDGRGYSTTAIGCSSEAQISVAIKSVAKWAMQFHSRIHFEWIWDGRRVFIVQADCEDDVGGVDPEELINVTVPKLAPADLKVFALAGANDFAEFGKLKNAQTYEALGYTMPPFFVLTDELLLSQILAGEIPAALAADLASLTVRPLVIRTDGRSIPLDKREMLPRSDELRSERDARRWLVEEFAPKINNESLGDCGLVLIAHHFVPSTASAWARAEPEKSLVRIESLWGIPEGLYWYSHDTFQVDTRTERLQSDESFSGSSLPFSQRLRYKGSFVAPNEVGAFVHQRTVPSRDWSTSVRRDVWLSQIAWDTRRIAAREGKAVAAMWFVDTHPGATKHRVLPWFHSSSHLSESPKAAPRNKLRGQTEFRIETTRDWDRLRAIVAEKKSIDRVIVEPTDPDLVRHRRFADDLALIAKEQEIVVQLSGGILSHAYYVLTRAGAKVECVDLFGDEDEVSEFDKLIRDHMPAGIVHKGEHVETVRLKGQAHVLALQQKLVEEALETLDARAGEEMLSELSDVLEVVDCLARLLGESRKRVDRERVEKLSRRGGFDGGTMLLSTATPGTLRKRTSLDSTAEELALADVEQKVISDPAQLPARPIYRRPDLRVSSDSELEKLLTVELDVTRLGEPVRELLNFSLPDSNGGAQRFSLILELRREGVALRTIVRLRRTELQLELPLSTK